MLHSQKMRIGNHVFEWGKRTYLMGILNITPDSFSGDGLFHPGEQDALDAGRLVEDSLAQAAEFVDAGVDFLDVGGESTRPGADQVDIDAELARVVPVIQSLSKEFDIPISVDTYKHSVAQAALEAGADLVNDIWGLNADPDMAPTIAKYGVPIIIMHNRSSWAHADIKESLGGRYVGVPYDDLFDDIKR